MEYLAFLEKNWVLVLAFVLSGGMLLWPLATRRLSTVTEIGTAEVTRLMNKEEFRTKLLETSSPADVLETFRKEEASYFEI